MFAAGVIVEYNPFHNGHLYHLKQTKSQTGADVIIAVMSGNFLQRGEPAIVSKWERTRMALAGGADLVIELPYLFATQKADTFARGAISILDAMKTEVVCFGSENGGIEDFHRTYHFMNKNETQYNLFVEEYMKKGYSYPKASSLAFQSLEEKEADPLDLSQPNNILGYQYVRAIYRLGSTIKPATLKRTGAGYHDKEISVGEIASATSIRHLLFKDKADLDALKPVTPNTTLARMRNYQKRYKHLHSWESYFDLLKYRLLTMSSDQLREIYEAEEGLENRLLEFIHSSETFAEFLEGVKTKRYTWTRLQRFCTHILTNTTKAEIASASDDETAEYIRLLGMTDRGRAYLRMMKKQLELPLVTTPSKFDNRMFALDRKAVRAYASALKEPYRSRMLKEEYATPPIQVKDSARFK